MQLSTQKGHSFVAFDEQGRTQIIQQINEVPLYKNSYIQIPKYSSPSISSQPYLDSSFPYEKLQEQSSGLEDRHVVFVRLAQLYPDYEGSLFAYLKQTHHSKLVKSNFLLPHFIYQMNHFDSSVFRRLFLTQNIVKGGRYEILINRNGSYQVQTVDDYVPVIQSTRDPIWQLDCQKPWQLILAKVWAKQVNGYNNIKKQTKPFEFIQYFTPCTWRYFNLAKEGRSFLSNYVQKVGKTCKILLKSKLDEEVQRCGLIRGQIVYELIQLDHFTQNNKQEFNLLIKSVIPHQWTGSLSIFDNKFKAIFKRLKNPYQLDSQFLLNQPDFFNLFSTAYVTTSKQQFPQFITNRSFKVQAEPKPYLFQFQVLTKGYLILTVRNHDENKINESMYIRKPETNDLNSIKTKRYQFKNEIYLQYKFMMSKNELKPVSSGLTGFQKIKRFFSPQKIPEQTPSKDSLFSYSLKDFEYNLGFCKGEAHPMVIEPGNYTIRFESERAQKQYSSFTIQCVCHQLLRLQPVDLKLDLQVQILKQSLLSSAQQLPMKLLFQGAYIYAASQFYELGYDYIIVKIQADFKGKMTIIVDIQMLAQEGWSLFLTYPQKMGKVWIELYKEQHQVFIFTRQQIAKNRKTFLWPPKAFKVYKGSK